MGMAHANGTYQQTLARPINVLTHLGMDAFSLLSSIR